MRSRSARLVPFVAGLLSALPSSSSPWPGFRGPNGSGVGDAVGLPVRFGPEENLAWRTEVPFGRSSPVLTERAVVVTGADDEHLHVVALDRGTGARLWSRALARARTEEVHPANDSATPTPATDGRNVFVFFPELGLVAFDEAGDERWRVPLGPFVNHYGMSASPVLAGDTLIQLCDQQIGSFLLAVDAETGEERWRADRSDTVESFTTPVLVPGEEPTRVVVSGSFRVSAYSVETGREEWRRPGFAYSPMPSPSVVGGTLFVCSPHPPEFPMPEYDALLARHDADESGALIAAEMEGSHLHFGWLDADKDGLLRRGEYEFARAGMRSEEYGLVALELRGEEAPLERWRVRRGLPLISSPLVHDGVVYLAKDGGVLTLLDAEDGGVLERRRLPGAIGPCYPSPVAADGRVFVPCNAGSIAVLAAGGDGELLATNDLGEECLASPAIGRDSLFVRTAAAVYRFREGG